MPRRPARSRPSAALQAACRTSRRTISSRQRSARVMCKRRTTSACSRTRSSSAQRTREVFRAGPQQHPHHQRLQLQGAGHPERCRGGAGHVEPGEPGDAARLRRRLQQVRQRDQSRDLPAECRNGPWVVPIDEEVLLAHFRIVAGFASGDLFATGAMFVAVPPGVDPNPVPVAATAANARQPQKLRETATFARAAAAERRDYATPGSRAMRGASAPT